MTCVSRERFYWPHMRRNIENFIHQRTMQAPKRLTYDSPGNPIYLREMNIRPPSRTSQFWIQPPVPCMPEPPVPCMPEPPLNQYGTLPPAMPCLIPPAVPMMFWSANTMMPYIRCLVQHHLTFHNGKCHTSRPHADRLYFDS